MRPVVLSLALLAIVAAGPAAAGFEIQMMMSEYNSAENVAKLKRGFDLAAAERQRSRQAIEISCAPGKSTWCAKEFAAACERHDGDTSANPDGSATCSFPAK